MKNMTTSVVSVGTNSNVRTITVGTNHFASIDDARRYYRRYGMDRRDVARKLRDGEIVIGEPELMPGDRLRINRQEGRYIIER